jgi:hypothetical protein
LLVYCCRASSFAPQFPGGPRVLALRALFITLLSPRTAAGVKSNFPTLPVAAYIARRKTPGHEEVPLLQSPRGVFHFSHLSCSARDKFASSALPQQLRRNIINQPDTGKSATFWLNGRTGERGWVLQTWAGRRKVVWKIFTLLQYFQ